MPDTDPQNPVTSEAIVDEGEAPASGSAEAGATTEASKEAPSGDPLEQARAEAAKLKDQWLRTAADFDNFRKRSRREVDDAKKSGREDLLRSVLPVFDNLERAIQSATRTNDVKAVAEGLTMVLRQFHDALGRTGIQKVPTVGQPFDPSVHEAIQQVETSDHPAGTVIAEVQPGYVQGERLIRAALVVVAKGQEAKKASDDGSGQPTN